MNSKSKYCPIIDSHFHYKFRGYNEVKLKEYIEEKRVEKIWLLSWEEKHPHFASNYTNLSPDDIWEACQVFKDKIVPFYAPDPCDENSSKRLEYWKNKGFRGCGELKVRCNWESKEVDKLLDTANNLEMPVIFHMENESESFTLKRSIVLDKLIDNLCKLSYRINEKRNGFTTHILKMALSDLLNSLISTRKFLHTKKIKITGYLNDIFGLEKMLHKYPSLKFVGHGPDFWSSIQSDARKSDVPTDSSSIIRLLSNNENLYADLSAKSGFNALNENRVYTNNLLKKFKDKFLYGTDNFSLGLDQLIDGLEIPELVKDQIFFSNANSFFDN